MKIYRSVAYSRSLNPTEKLVWSYIADCIEVEERFRGTRWVELSISSIAARLNISRNTAKKSIDRLVSLDLIERQHSIYQGRADLYTVPSEEIMETIMQDLHRSAIVKSAY